MRYRATVAYDGAEYHGFQRQNDAPTIQLALEQAIRAVTGADTTVTGAGRTDAGVHASGQVIAFDLPAWGHDAQSLLRAINARLPASIALQDIAPAPGFHPRFDALARRYGYTVIRADARQPLLRGRAWQVIRPAPLDFEAMRAAAALFIGRHDFAAFGQPPQGDNTEREVMISEWELQPGRYGEHYQYTVEANAFLYHMVRRLVGVQVDVGRGRLSLAELAQILTGRDIARVRTLAPPHGLVLEAVRYHR